MPLSLKITDAGKLAAFNANTNGLQVAIAEVGIGTARYSASVGATALQAEVVRVSVLSSVLVSASQRTLKFKVGGTTAIDPVGEIGLYLNDTPKTLFAVWSEPVGSGFIVGTKGTNTDLLVNCNLLLGDLPTGSVTVIQQEPVAGLVPQVGGFGGEGNYELSGAATLSGVKRYQNFILRTGAVLTVDRTLDVRCSGYALIEPGATVNVTQASPGGGGNVIGQMSNVKIAFGAGYKGFGPGSTSGYRSPGKAYNPDFFGAGSGGQTGWLIKTDATDLSYNTGKGGDGGGRLTIEAAVGIDLGGTVNTNGGNATAGTITNFDALITGNGGGSGGFQRYQTPGYFIIRNSAVFNANGGNGSNGLSTAAYTLASNGGTGATGGVLEFIGPGLPLSFGTATLSVAGGTGGTSTNTGSGGSFAGGSGGAFGADASAQPVVNTVINGSAGKISILRILA